MPNTVSSSAPSRRGPAITISGSLAIAVGLAAVSYSHLLEAVMAGGADLWEAIIIAGTVDSLILMAICTIADARRRGVPVPAVAVVALLAGIVATTAANLYGGVAHGWLGVAISLWVPIAALLAEQLVARVIRQTRTTPVAAETTPAADSDTATDAPSDTQPPTPDGTRPPTRRDTTRPPSRHDGGRVGDIAQVVSLGQLSDRDRQVLALIEEQPDITGVEVGERLGVHARTGQRALTRAQALARKAAEQATATPDTATPAVSCDTTGDTDGRVAAAT
ncbi:hypothetical protein [Nocardiopsis sp. YSL2]|uniref:hypothetical protein n=1 Tax=Nocardiopsis sp. YSL2 TaxID=2939492 RepID=UPI0026F41F2C|nr:hypothetical protein [Nocardiopsis sp. YSL2]